MQANKSELLAMKVLDGALDRARLLPGERYPVLVLRAARFVDILKSAPHLVTYRLDWANSGPHWPRFIPMYNDAMIRLDEHAIEAAL